MTEERLDAMRYKALKEFIDELEKHYTETRNHWSKQDSCVAEFHVNNDNGKLHVIESLKSLISSIENY